MTDEQWAQIQETAADNARMCEIIVAADKLIEAARAHLTALKSKRELGRTGNEFLKPTGSERALREALENYVVVRQGQ